MKCIALNARIKSEWNLHWNGVEGSGRGLTVGPICEFTLKE